MDNNSKRLYALDALRGLDMLLLTVIGPLVCAAQRGWSCFSPGFMRQFDHYWHGFTLWDIIMPLFIFMCGAAMPFALEKRLQQGQGVFWKHVAKRVVLLWFLGGLVQGNWAALDPLTFSPYSNTLQTIAFGYLIVALVMAAGWRLGRIIVPVALAALYTVLLAWSGDYGEYTNLAYRIDHAVLAALLPAGSKWVTHPSFYTWFLTSTMFAAMAFAGFNATQILRADRQPARKAVLLLVYAVALLAVGFVSEIWIPCIKPIFTLSFTAQAMGWCVLALDVLYVLTDIYRVRVCSPVLMLFGQCALTAYFTSHFFEPVLTAFARVVGKGLVKHLPTSAEPFVLMLLAVLGMVIVMVVKRGRKS